MLGVVVASSTQPPSRINPLSSSFSDKPRPTYTLPSTKDILVNTGKRRRDYEEETHNSFTKRAKTPDFDEMRPSTAYELVVGSSSVVSVSGGYGKTGLHSPSQDASGYYMAAQLGFQGQEEACYEYGSDDDEDTTFLCDDSDADPTRDGEVGVAFDISTDAFSAEIDRILREQCDRAADQEDTAGPPDSDIDEDMDMESNDDDDDDDVQLPIWSGPAWRQPGPSRLRQSFSPQLLRTSSGTAQANRVHKPKKIVRDPRKRVDSYNLRTHTLNACHMSSLSRLAKPQSTEPSPSSESQDKSNEPKVDAADAGGLMVEDEREERADQDDGKDEDVETMGRGTPPGDSFTARPILCSPPSRYNYSVRDCSLPVRRFGQDALYGDRSWSTLFRGILESTKADEWDAKRVTHLILVGVRDTARFVEMRTDRKAMRLWREHEEQISFLAGRSRAETTGTLIAEMRVAQEILTGRASPVPHPHDSSDLDSKSEGEDWEESHERMGFFC